MDRSKKIVDLETLKSGEPADCTGTIQIITNGTQEEIKELHRLYPGALIINESWEQLDEPDGEDIKD